MSLVTTNVLPCTNLENLHLYDVVNQTPTRLLAPRLADGRLALDFTYLRKFSVGVETVKDTQALIRYTKQLEWLQIDSK